jgi:hypothetical protein
MKSIAQKFLAFAMLSVLAAASPVDLPENGQDWMEINHDGVMQFSKGGASLNAIGKSELTIGNHLLTVDGQFRIFGSTKLSRSKKRGDFRAKPVLISLVAVGDIHVKSVAGSSASKSAKKAVYLFKESRWILDDEPWAG